MEELKEMMKQRFNDMDAKFEAVGKLQTQLEEMDLKMGKRFNDMDAKFEAVEKLQTQLEEMDLKMGKHAQTLEQMQVKVNLTMETLGKVQEDQNRVTSSLSGAGVTPLVIPEREVNTILGQPPARQLGMPQDRPPPAPSERVHPRQLALPASGTAPRVTIPPTPTVYVYDDANGLGSSRGANGGERADDGRHSWMPKMDFPKFDGTDVRIWIDTCNTFFLLYNIAKGFKVSAATMYMRDSAAHWYQAYKLKNPWHNWSTFSVDVVHEFERNAQRDKIRELLTLKQMGTVDEYKKQFDKLVYHIKLYDPNMGSLMLVQRFILGLKEELRAAVEVQLPNTVAEAALFAQIQESVLERTKSGFTRSYHKKTTKMKGPKFYTCS
ncbi:hypothetical protein ACQ4PT_066987 [Festuca glaucescens]